MKKKPKYLDYTRYYTILSDDEMYELSVLINEKNECCMQSLCIDPFKKEDKYASWDNLDYLTNKLVPWLNKKRKSKSLKKEISKKDRKYLRRMFKQAKKDGMFSKKLKL